MKLRNGKKYIFKTRTKKKEVMPEYVKKIIDYIKRNFAYSGIEIIQTDYKVVKCQSRPKR